MTSDLLVKGLLRQAGISVFAGLLLSSAALAAGMGEPVGEPDMVSVSIDDGGPDVAVDPGVDGTDPGASDGETGGEDTAGEDDGGISDDDGVDLGGEDGVVSIDDTCANCSGMPDAPGETVDMVAEFGVTSVQRDDVRGGGATGGPTGGRDISRDAVGDKGRGAGRDGDLGARRLLIVK